MTLRRGADTLTLLRIALSMPLALSIVNGISYLALTIAVLGAFTDLADGFLARREKAENSLGKALDPLADKIFVLSGLIALVEVDKVSSLPVILILFRELSVSLLRSLMIANRMSMPSSQLSKVKTFLEFVALVLIVADHFSGVYVLWISVLVAYVSAFEYVRVYRRHISGLNYH